MYAFVSQVLKLCVAAALFLPFSAWPNWPADPGHLAQGGSGQFIVKLKDAVELSAQPSLRRLEKDGETLHALMARNNVDAHWLRAGSLGSQIMAWGPTVRPHDQQSLLNRLESDPQVEWAMEDRALQMRNLPNDPSFSNQWALRSQSGTAGARFDKAWELSRGSADVVVAVLDTGVVFDTPELAGRLLAGYDFVSDRNTGNDGDGRDPDASDPGNWVSQVESESGPFRGCAVRNSSWHGTFVAGQVAANTQNNSGVAGADWNVKVLPVRVLGKCGGTLSDVLDAMLWSAGLDVPGIPRNPTPARVINLSLGSPNVCSRFEQSVVDRVTQAGGLVVAAAGNGGGTLDTPANCPNVMAVGALDRDGSRASYSAMGAGIDLMAPGGWRSGLVGLGNTGNQGPASPALVQKTGTSFAAPLVSAAAALMVAVNPELSPAAIRAQLRNTAAPFLAPQRQVCQEGQGSGSCNCTQAVCGTGMLDAQAAVQASRLSRPIANAVAHVDSAGNLRLSGSSSVTPAGRVMASYQWQQVAGPAVLQGTRSEADTQMRVAGTQGDLAFQLTVVDSVGERHSAFTAVRVGGSGSSSQIASLPTNEIPKSGTPGATSGPENAANMPAPAAQAGGGGGGGSLGGVGLFGLFALLLMGRRRPAGPCPVWPK